MGQPIEVTATVVGSSVIFDTDRTITGQDGAAFASRDSATGDGFPATLARRLFEADAEVDSVFVASNVVTVTRRTSWDDAAVAAASTVVTDFFVFYGAA